MKLKTSMVGLAMAALFVGLFSAAPSAGASGETQQAGSETVGVPFKGALQGSDTPMPPNILATTGTGIATVLGRFSLTQEVAVDLATFTDAGEAYWAASNGDLIHTLVEGFAVPAGEVGLTITETHVVVGGTGRFAGARGTFTVVRTHLFAPGGDGTHATFGSFEGSLAVQGMVQAH